ncbi:MAG: ABC transporter ATP-binding protein [Alphaproteobacteria bacterium]|nr:ABC transporter ATP-binding protein [Alphaproteobacteria bacterium]MBT4019797.1 ABC transporter ATP-binding protein [Alphaproteobacteria bacterium]MBT5158604.1 ABC transporter ATP-binding protein [Alphaproteobacteria bacterium]MBT5917394.1 ABC transporter ATP-binding protein [Alphaproteobacteria bacterium]MBT6384245.1 ABC transporter ATP-binding protein [Alphaproteobacteria bacterium]
MTSSTDDTGVQPGGNNSLPAAIELQGISKAFGLVQANKDVSIKVEAGTIHGIVGENGAGKSTLMSILYGFYEADAGTIQIDGKHVQIKNSNDAIASGIGMVHQHFMLVDTFTVLENVMMGAESGALLRDSVIAARAELERLEKEYGLHVDPDALASELPVGQLQRVEILKALYRGARILILDEPTGVLTPQEAEQLFRILGALKDQGVTIVLITHKLREIMDVTDNVEVMRHGKMVAHRVTSETNKEELAELMVGRKIRADIQKEDANPGATALVVEGLTVRDSYGIAKVDNVSFQVKTGEIVGIAGVSGNGQSELLEALSGITALDEGRISYGDRDVTPTAPVNPEEVRKLGVAHVPEDRQKLGMVTDFSAWESAILGYHRDDAFQKGLFLDPATVKAHCASLMDRFDVRPPTPEIKSANFSGGNQQKLILAREIDRNPKVLLVGQPTRGVDIGAIEFIHRQLVDLRDKGGAVLLISVELEEVMTLADRILVMFEGRIVAEVAGDKADEKTLGLMMANAMTEPEMSDEQTDGASA